MEASFADRKMDRAMITVLGSEECFASEVSREIDTTYAHCVKIVSTLVKAGYMEKEAKGRKNILYLTEKGQEIAQKLLETRNIEKGI